MLVDKPNNWTIGQWEDFLKKINQCISKREAHWESYYIYSKFDTIVNLPTIILSSLLSTLSVSHLAESEDNTTNNKKIYNYVMVATSVSITVLTTISKFFNYGQIKELHKITAINYEKIRSELIQYVEDRNDNITVHNYNEFIKLYYIKINTIRENEPSIIPSRKKKWDIDNNVLIDIAYIDNSPPVSEISIDPQNFETEV